MTKNIISVTNTALFHFKNLLHKNNAKALILGVKGGGCNGFEYDIKPTNSSLKKGDELYNKDNINIHICGKSLLYLLGTNIDWKDDLMGSCFIFNNPNAINSCGCGTSFNAAPADI